MTINSVAVEILGDGRTNPTDGKLLNQLRDISDHLKANDGAALRGGDMAALKGRLDGLLEVRARNGAQTNRLDAAQTRIDQITGALTNQLSNTEDADIAKTLIQFNSQSAAYQAALRGGDMTGLQNRLDGLLQIRARNGAQTNRLDAAHTRLDQINGTLTDQLSNTEDADIGKTLIDFNSQSAAYQAALKAGANIVQASLMDFLR
jgi:flagellin-like hook-associated protein FlgL